MYVKDNTLLCRLQRGGDCKTTNDSQKVTCPLCEAALAAMTAVALTPHFKMHFVPGTQTPCGYYTHATYCRKCGWRGP